jgi:hypothetical protein
MQALRNGEDSSSEHQDAQSSSLLGRAASAHYAGMRRTG